MLVILFVTLILLLRTDILHVFHSSSYICMFIVKHPLEDYLLSFRAITKLNRKQSTSEYTLCQSEYII